MTALQHIDSPDEAHEPQTPTCERLVDEFKELLWSVRLLSYELVDSNGRITITFAKTADTDYFLEIVAGSYSSAPGSPYQSVLRQDGISLCAVVGDPAHRTGHCGARPGIRTEIDVSFTHAVLYTVIDQLWVVVDE